MADRELPAFWDLHKGRTGTFIRTEPADVEGFSHVIWRAPNKEWFAGDKTIYMVPNAAIHEEPAPIQDEPGIPKRLVVLEAAEQGQSALKDRLGILQNRNVSLLQNQLNDLYMQLQGVMLDKQQALQGAKETMRSLSDIKGETEKRRHVIRGGDAGRFRRLEDE